jgi:hypothetical protein
MSFAAMRDGYFELTSRQTSAATRNVAAAALIWFAIEVVE